MVKYHGVLKQVNHGKILWIFETGKLWYTIQLRYTIYEKAWSTTVYHVTSGVFFGGGVVLGNGFPLAQLF